MKHRRRVSGKSKKNQFWNDLFNEFKKETTSKLISTVALVIAILGTFLVAGVDMYETLYNFTGSRKMGKHERAVIISGQVFDLNAGMPIKDAKIIFESANIVTLTDSLGRFEITIEATKSRNEFSFYVLKDGYGGIYRSKGLMTQDSIMSFNLGLAPIE